MTEIPELPSIRQPKIRGIEVDKDLANAVFVDDMMLTLQTELASEAVSIKSILSLLGMIVPAMVGIMASMLANLNVALMTYFGKYTIADLMTQTIIFYFGLKYSVLLLKRVDNCKIN